MNNLSSLSMVFGLAFFILIVPYVFATQWTDCGDESSVVHFTSLESVPDPVKTGDQQIIYKTGFSDRDIATLKCDFKQYFYRYGVGVRFLHITVDTCSEHPGLCPLKAGLTFNMTTVHPPLSKLTPYGLYRSLQNFYDGDTGDHVGCVDLSVEYVPASQL